MTIETEKLLSLLYQANAELQVKDGFLLVSPQSVALKFGDQIRKLKPQILLSLGHCPKCGAKLIEMTEKDFYDHTKTHVYCSAQEPWHYDRWSF